MIDFILFIENDKGYFVCIYFLFDFDFFYFRVEEKDVNGCVFIYVVIC